MGRRRERGTALLAGVITSLALVLRFTCVDCWGLWYDEVASVEIARRGSEAILTDRFGGMLVQTPLHYLLVLLGTLVADPASTTFWVRLPSLVAGAAAVPVVFALGNSLFGRGVGVLAALLVALSAVHIGHSQDARPYTLLVLFTALGSLFLSRALQHSGQSAKWWLLFGGSMAANILFSYHALTLALPALLIFTALFFVWHRRLPAARNWVGLAVALILITMVSVPGLLDVLRVRREAPQWSNFTIQGTGDELGRLLGRLTQIGLPVGTEQWAQWSLFAMAVLGSAGALRQKRRSGLLLCLVIILVPAVILAVYKTSNTVFQRYALFALPYYLLLIANGMVSIPYLTSRLTGRRLSGLLVGSVGAGVVGLFALGTWLYFSPDPIAERAHFPDFRATANFLTATMKQGDAAIVLDTAGQGDSVTNFYAGKAVRASLFDARDPRIASLEMRRPGGDLYWVVNLGDGGPDLTDELARRLGGTVGATANRVSVLKVGETVGLRKSFADMVAALDQAKQGFALPAQTIATMQGCVLQLDGDAQGAAAAYASAGPFFSLSDEFLESARGYYVRGDGATAWREAATSKALMPSSVELHAWYRDAFAAAGNVREGAVEDEIVKALAP